MDLYDFIGEAKPLRAPIQHVMCETKQTAPKASEPRERLESYVVVAPFHEAAAPDAIWSDAVFLSDHLREEEARWGKMRRRDSSNSTSCCTDRRS